MGSAGGRFRIAWWRPNRTRSSCRRVRGNTPASSVLWRSRCGCRPRNTGRRRREARRCRRGAEGLDPRASRLPSDPSSCSSGARPISPATCPDRRDTRFLACCRRRPGAACWSSTDQGRGEPPANRRRGQCPRRPFGSNSRAYTSPPIGAVPPVSRPAATRPSIPGHFWCRWDHCRWCRTRCQRRQSRVRPSPTCRRSRMHECPTARRQTRWPPSA